MIPRGGKLASYLQRLSGKKPRRLVLLGSTGSIGRSALDLAARYPQEFTVLALGAGGNVARLAEQALLHRPQLLAVKDREAAERLRVLLRGKLEPAIEIGEEGLCRLASLPEADLVLCAIVGFAGLRSTLAALQAGKDVALANKESLVVAGELVRRLTAGEADPCVLPVDSEHSAIFQALQGMAEAEVETIILTASGGPFLRRPLDQFSAITPEMALNHPRWKMGPKVTIDSSTMFNKGLELIEAHWLFDLPASRVQIVIHPQSIVHSMVQAVDGSVLAQLGQTDMRGPIAYALTYPRRLPGVLPPLSFPELRALEFFPPEEARFPALRIAAQAAQQGGSYPCAMNAANEVAVAAFLERRLPYTGIARLVDGVLQSHRSQTLSGWETIGAADAEARRAACALLPKEF